VGWVTIAGSQASDSGYVLVSVYGYQVTYTYSQTDTADSVVVGLAGMFNNPSSPVNASPSGNVLSLTSKATGSAANSQLTAIYGGTSFSTGAVGMIGGRDGARNFQMSLFYQSGADADVGFQLMPLAGNANPQQTPQLTPQPPGLSILSLGDTWMDVNFETQLTAALNQNLIDLTRVDAVYVDEPYPSYLGALAVQNRLVVRDAQGNPTSQAITPPTDSNPCAASDPRLFYIRSGYSLLQTAAAVIKKYSPHTRFWVNFSRPEADWMTPTGIGDSTQHGSCAFFQQADGTTATLDAPYIDVVSVDWYEKDFLPNSQGLYVQQVYDWFQAHRSYPGQQLALVPGTHVLDYSVFNRTVDPVRQAQLVEQYFDYAAQMNQSCTLPLGNNGGTGSFDGCPVWMVIGWVYDDRFGFYGLSDLRASAIQAAWQAELSTPRVDPRPPAVQNFARIANANNFFYIDEAGDVLQSWTNSSSSNAGGWHTPSITGIAGAPAAMAGSNLLTYSDPVSSNGDIYYVGTDQHVHLLWWNGDPWKTLDLTATTGGPNAQPGFPFVHPGAGNSFEYLGADGNIWLFWNDSSSSSTSWHTANLNAIASAPTAASGGTPLGYTDPISNNTDVYYVGTDGHVHLLWWNGDPWHTIDLTATTAGPSAQAGTQFVRIANANNFFYLGTDGNVWQFWNSGSSSNASTWHSACISCIAQAPIAAAGSPLLAYTDPISNNGVLYYIGADQDVHLLWWNGDPWRTLDLTAATGGPKASALAPMVAPAANGFFYLGTDANVYQFWTAGSTSDAGAWHSANISAIANAPAAIPGSMMFGYIDPISNGPSVYYIGSDQHVHLLWWTADPWRTLDITAVTTGPNVL
jgi:hypothetical protein